MSLVRFRLWPPFLLPPLSTIRGNKKLHKSLKHSALRLPVKVHIDDKGNVVIGPAEGVSKKDYIRFIGRCFGTVDMTLAYNILNQLTGLVGGPKLNSEALNTALAYMFSFQPETPMEAMLAAQMAATQVVSLQLLKGSLGNLSLDVAAHMSGRAFKCQNLLLRQMETWQRLRGSGPTQQVVVKHVEVKEGGQAVVGVVTRGSGKNEKAGG